MFLVELFDGLEAVVELDKLIGARQRVHLFLPLPILVLINLLEQLGTLHVPLDGDGNKIQT